MGDELTAAAWRVRYRIMYLWIASEPGELRLEDGLLAFRSEDRGLVFRAPLAEVRASFPKLIFPIPCFGVGVKLAVHGETYRLSFVWWRYTGWGTTPGGGGSIGIGPTWSIPVKAFRPARAIVRQWRAVLEKPANGGQ